MTEDRELNTRSEKVLGTLYLFARYYHTHLSRRKTMHKFALALSTVAVIGFAAVPLTTPADAATIVIKKSDRGHHYGWERGRHFGWGRDRDRDHDRRTVIIRRGDRDRF
jgi:hypothetical protein